MTLPADTVLENRYRIERLLAHGGMGAVYKGFDIKLNIPVALKENFFQTPESIRQFEQEALILARLRHLGLPRVTDHFSFEERQYLVMDFIEGQDLWEMVKQSGQPLSERQALDYLIQVCQAVDYLHRQKPPIVHRDIKPQNIKISPDNRAVLVDFGIAKVDDESQTQAGAQGVTPGFSPLEQYSGKGTSPASDIYSLGATLYTVLTGQKPPDSVSLMVNRAKFVPPTEINPRLNQNISAAIIHAMQPYPTDRPQSVAIWLHELEQARKSLTTFPVNDAPTLLSTTDAHQLLEEITGQKDRTSVAEKQTELTIELELGDALRFILIPAGEFLMGSDFRQEPNITEAESPQQSLYLPNYYILDAEVTQSQYAAFIQASDHQEPTTRTGSPYRWNNCTPPEDKMDHPVVWISWQDAYDFCGWLSDRTGWLCRLPTEAEWEKAARGSKGFVYPWGNRWYTKRCNTEESGIGETTPVYHYPEGASPYGLMDTSGNVWEWTLSIYRPYPYDLERERQDARSKSIENRVLRGGAWNYNKHYARCAGRSRNPPYIRNNCIGFRVVTTRV